MRRLNWQAALLRPQYIALFAVLFINWLLFPGFFLRSNGRMGACLAA